MLKKQTLRAAVLAVLALIFASAAWAYNPTYCEQVFDPSSCGGDTTCQQIVLQEQAACIASTGVTITFDQFNNGLILTTEYTGMTISGADIATTCPTPCLFPPVSGTNVGYDYTGLIRVSFDTTIVGNVQTVSAYVTDYNEPAGIYAYDASNHLLGQAVMPSAGVNTFLSLTLSGIAYVTIHDGGGNFAVDNLAFTWSPITSPSYSCTGFQSPFNVALSLKQKVQRAIPLQMQLLDSSGNVVTDATIAGAAPVVNITYTGVNSTAVDDTSLLDPVGQSSSGNSFSYNSTTQTWQYNLSSSPFTASGTYTVTVTTGDATQYSVSPTCTGTFVRK